jgi:hypothetical protein
VAAVEGQLVSPVISCSLVEILTQSTIDIHDFRLKIKLVIFDYNTTLLRKNLFYCRVLSRRYSNILEIWYYLNSLNNGGRINAS